MSTRVVGEWLRTLSLDAYTDAFLENGYDDLEICRQVGEADLDAIGVSEPAHRSKIIAAVSRLAERTAGAALYFDLEEELKPERAALLTLHHQQQQQHHQQLLHHHSHNNHYHHHLQNHHQQLHYVHHHHHHHQQHQQHQQQQHLNVHPSEGARSSYSKLRLKVLLREKLLRDGITLGAPPYSSARVYLWACLWAYLWACLRDY
ncbi:sterile alpha motif domain-containing protein 5-like [Lampetra fluviatilis]